MGYFEDRLDIPVAESGEDVAYGTPDSTAENPDVNWLYSAQQVAALVDANMGKVGPLADRPAAGPDAPMLWFTTDTSPPRWTVNLGNAWDVAGESTDASSLNGKDPSKYVQTDAAPTPISVFHEYTAAGGVRFGDDADSSIEFSYDQVNNELDIEDTLNNDRLMRLFARASGTTAEFGAGAGPHTFRFGNDETDWLGLVYRTSPDTLGVEDEDGNELLVVDRDGSLDVDFQLDVGGKLDVRGTGGITATQGGITANGGIDAGGDLDLNDNEAKNFRIENRQSDPGNAATGRIWYRTDI
jgi:hypothetical protein